MFTFCPDSSSITKSVNKKLINSVLEKMIDIYQEYSGKGKSRELELAKNYLEEQINFYKVAGAKSMKDLQEFAIDQDLTALGYLQAEKIPADFPKDETNNTDNEFFGKTISIEAARVRAANKIRSIEAKIKKIESLPLILYLYKGDISNNPALVLIAKYSLS